VPKSGPEVCGAPVGIVAGGGLLPGLVAEACRSVGRRYFVLGLSGQADQSTGGFEPDAWVRLGAAEKLLGILRDAAVETVVLAGHVRRPSLAELRPDARALRVLARAARFALGDDGLLRAIIDEFEREGFRIVGADSLVDELLAPPGLWSKEQPGEQDDIDISRGVVLSRALGAVDVGQAAVIQGGHALAVEAAEGTTEMVRRAGKQRRAGGGGVLVKVAKPDQERRVDLPTIGPDTVTEAAAAGLAGIAVEAGSVLVIRREEVIERANALGLFVLGRRIDH
jgi:hypothetical protein